MVAPITVAPGPFCTGIDSPVSMDSSTSDSPVSTVPSTGILLPGRITTISPANTSAVGTSTSTPLRMTEAFAGVRSISAVMADDAPARARISSQWPSRMKTSRTATASKNCPPSLKKNVVQTLKRYPVPTLNTMSAAMPKVPFLSARQAETKNGQLG